MKNSQFLTTSMAILIGSVMISVSILISGGVIKFKGSNIKGSSIALGTQATTSPTPQTPEEDTRPVKVSVDDDPVLGNKNASVTLIEFSDYECPFCKRHFDQSYPQLKKDYIDSGKVKLVYRDLPLPFHDPMATTEAIAANCARESGGDTTYFKYHDEIFKRTTSNGNGLTKDDLFDIASTLGLNSSNFRACLESEKYKEEIQKDLDDASKVGASGTPTFFIGKSSNSGTIEGVRIVGAQPYSVFKSQIDKLL